MDLSPVFWNDTRQNRNQRRFTGTVRSQQSHDRPFLHGKGHVIQDGTLIIKFVKVGNLNHMSVMFSFMLSKNICSSNGQACLPAGVTGVDLHRLVDPDALRWKFTEFSFLSDVNGK
jgi:hypothetical protein